MRLRNQLLTTRCGQLPIVHAIAFKMLAVADWIMVTFKASDKPKWVIRSSADAIRFYSDGPVEITKAGNLKIGRITMQRKGGDNGRETAKMLQFKMNPVLLFEGE